MGKRKFQIVLFPNPEKKIITFNIEADAIDIDPRGNVQFKDDGRLVGVVSNPAYQVIKEIKEITVVSK